MESILLIEDDKLLRQGLSYDLEAEGYQVYSAETIGEAIGILEEKEIHLILLDGNLPDGDGFRFCRGIKAEKNLPVILLTARDLEQDELEGFEAGADDYVKKPFSLPVLYKRIEVALRSCGPKEENFQYNDGFLYVDFRKMIAKKGGSLLELTAKEFRMLSILIANKNQVVTKSALKGP